MPIKVKGAIAQAFAHDLGEGELYALQDGDGWLYAMNASTEHERFCVVLGASGTSSDDKGAGFVPFNQFAQYEVIGLAGAYIEPLVGTAGFPVGEKDVVNGSVIVDRSGAHWIYTVEPGRARVYWNLESGAAGKPAGGVVRYNSWRIMWRSETAMPNDPAVELYRFAAS